MSKILVVEDSSDMRLIMNDILGSLGHEVVEAVDGLDGVRAALRTHPDLIILDLMMPMVHGGSFLHYKHNTPGLEHIPVLVVSAHSDYEELARSHGADGWLQKPVRISDLNEQITRLLATPKSKS
jgi:two-component system cell cycle response regulator DivK